MGWAEDGCARDIERQRSGESVTGLRSRPTWNSVCGKEMGQSGYSPNRWCTAKPIVAWVPVSVKPISWSKHPKISSTCRCSDNLVLEPCRGYFWNLQVTKWVLRGCVRFRFGFGPSQSFVCSLLLIFHCAVAPRNLLGKAGANKAKTGLTPRGLGMGYVGSANPGFTCIET